MGQVFVTNAGNLALRKRALAGQTAERFRQAAQMQAARMKFVAESLSAGPLSTAQIARQEHPYSSALPENSAPYVDYIINKQTGLLNRSWVTRVQQTSQGWTITLYNTAPEAKFMLGTKRMRVRPILAEVDRRTAAALVQAARSITRRTVAANGGLAPVNGNWGGVLYAVGVGFSSAAGAVEGTF